MVLDSWVWCKSLDAWRRIARADDRRNADWQWSFSMATQTEGRMDEGTAYGRKPQLSNQLLTEVGPGTPCGELMRRYWQPIAVSRKVGDLPQKVRVLSEDLILFRD